MSDAKAYDVAIVGGGVIGLALAWRLVADGARVALLDDGAPAATAASAGMLAPSFERGAVAIAEPLYRLSIDSLERWRAFAEALRAEGGVDIDYRSDGVLGVAFTQRQAGALRDAAAALAARGGAADWMSGDDARRLEPGLSADVIAGLFARKDAQVDARRLIEALRQAIVRRGGAIFAARARRIDADDNSASIILGDGGRVVARRAVIAAGAAALSLNLSPIPPIYPVKGEAFALAAPRSPIRHVVRAPGAYLCPKADGRLIIGASEIAGADDLHPSPVRIAAMQDAAARAVPGVAGLAEIERWAGVRPATPDGAPILGPDPRGPSSVILALGHYRNGVLLAPATAALLTPLVLGEAGDARLAAFSPARFPAGLTISEILTMAGDHPAEGHP